MPRCVRSMSSYLPSGVSAWQAPPRPAGGGSSNPIKTDIPRPLSNELPQPTRTRTSHGIDFTPTVTGDRNRDNNRPVESPRDRSNNNPVNSPRNRDNDRPGGSPLFQEEPASRNQQRRRDRGLPTETKIRDRQEQSQPISQPQQAPVQEDISRPTRVSTPLDTTPTRVTERQTARRSEDIDFTPVSVKRPDPAEEKKRTSAPIQTDPVRVSRPEPVKPVAPEQPQRESEPLNLTPTRVSRPEPEKRKESAPLDFEPTKVKQPVPVTPGPEKPTRVSTPLDFTPTSKPVPQQKRESAPLDLTPTPVQPRKEPEPVKTFTPEVPVSQPTQRTVSLPEPPKETKPVEPIQPAIEKAPEPVKPVEVEEPEVIRTPIPPAIRFDPVGAPPPIRRKQRSGETIGYKPRQAESEQESMPTINRRNPFTDPDTTTTPTPQPSPTPTRIPVVLPEPEPQAFEPQPWRQEVLIDFADYFKKVKHPNAKDPLPVQNENKLPEKKNERIQG